MSRYVLGFEEIDETQAAAVGGKGAHLGELSHRRHPCAARFLRDDGGLRRIVTAPSLP